MKIIRQVQFSQICKTITEIGKAVEKVSGPNVGRGLRKEIKQKISTAGKVSGKKVMRAGNEMIIDFDNKRPRITKIPGAELPFEDLNRLSKPTKSGSEKLVKHRWNYKKEIPNLRNRTTTITKVLTTGDKVVKTYPGAQTEINWGSEQLTIPFSNK